MIKTYKSEPLGKAHLLTTVIRIALTAMCMSVFAAPQAFAQDQADASAAQDTDVLEEVIVTGTRQLIKDSIEIKRDNIMVVDGLSASDIGDLPALSIGEALESLTGVASHRENGGATEVSIRGLGPFLSATTFNGREATNGSGDRSVNFSQFPSELMNKLVVYKTQDATLIEGGVAGVIALETLKPLDYGKRRFQFDAKGNWNPDQQNIMNSQSGNWGWRGTLSYVDQWETRNGGNIGMSLGYQKSDISQPEAEVNSSSPSSTPPSLYACINDPSVTKEGLYRSSSGDCEDQVGGLANQGYNTAINPATGKAYSDGLAFAFAPSSRGYKMNDTEDERDAFFAAFQWQPNEDWDINLDYEQSERTQAELRHVLNFANMKRVTKGVTGPATIVSDTGAVQNWLSTSAIESNPEKYSRKETYHGGGLNIAYQVNERLAVSGDFSYSKTERIERQISIRLQSDAQDIYGNDTPGGYQPGIQWDLETGIPQYVLQNFNVTDWSLFSDEYRARIDSDVDRTNEIKSGRLDFDLEVDWGAITSLEGGVRYSELTYLNLAGTRYESPNLDDSSAAERAAILAINEACRAPFQEKDFLSAESNGNLVTNIDSETGEEISGTGNTWATFDVQCLTDMILDYHGVEFAYPEQFRKDTGTTDVTETTFAGYLMANFEKELAGKTVTGNFGLRVVNTEVKSEAWRSAYEITEDGGFYSIAETGVLDLDKAKHSYTEWLPSLNAVMDLTDAVLLRGAAYRAMSRADPGDLGYNRSFVTNTSEDITDPDDLITSVAGSGNPATDPLMSWNFDTAIEWYPNEDSILTFGLYYKSFQGGFIQETTLESFVVDGVEIERPVTVTQTDGNTSTLWGIEVTAAHNFSYLPGAFLSGLGAKIGYNYGNSDFEFEDSQYGDLYMTDLDGNRTQTNIGIVAPGNVPGFSDNVFSGVVYGEWGAFGASMIYKYRSEYFQPYTSDGTRLRFIGDTGVWEARASYEINDNLTLSIEGINLFNEPKKQYFFTRDNLGEVNSYGARYFIGLRGKF